MFNGNPIINKIQDSTTTSSQLMTVEGTIHRTGFLTLILVLSGMYSFNNITDISITWIALIVGFLLAMFIIFVPISSPFLAPVYAAIEGVVLGTISMLFEEKYSGIALQAAIGTVGVMFLMLCLYRLRLLRATPKFVKGVMAAMFGIVVVYVINLITTLFFQSPLPILHDSTPLGIGISIIICGVAALSFIIDFDMIEQNAGHAPKFMEWYAAFGILVTLVWLYIEMLNLLRKFRN